LDRIETYGEEKVDRQFGSSIIVTVHSNNKYPHLVLLCSDICSQKSPHLERTRQFNKENDICFQFGSSIIVTVHSNNGLRILHSMYVYGVLRTYIVPHLVLLCSDICPQKSPHLERTRQFNKENDICFIYLYTTVRRISTASLEVQ
jgi:hypothetical protein